MEHPISYHHIIAETVMCLTVDMFGKAAVKKIENSPVVGNNEV